MRHGAFYRSRSKTSTANRVVVVVCREPADHSQHFVFVLDQGPVRWFGALELGRSERVAIDGEQGEVRHGARLSRPLQGRAHRA